MFTGGLVSVLLLVLRLVFLYMRTSAEQEGQADLRGWDQRPDPKHRSRRSGVVVDVAVRQPLPGGAVTSAAVRAPWAFGSGPTLTLTSARALGQVGEGHVRTFIGEGDQYVVRSDGSKSAELVLTRMVLGRLDHLPPNLVLRTSEKSVELVLHGEQLGDAVLRHASKIVGEVAGYGTPVLKELASPIEGVNIVDASGTTSAHAKITTRAGIADLDFDLEPHGLTATLALETTGAAERSAMLDAAGAIVSGDAAWLEPISREARRGAGPAKIALDGGMLEIAWREVPTREQLALGVELLVSLATGPGPAYR